jgi:hypothetical protein
MRKRLAAIIVGAVLALALSTVVPASAEGHNPASGHQNSGSFASPSVTFFRCTFTNTAYQRCFTAYIKPGEHLWVTIVQDSTIQAADFCDEEDIVNLCSGTVIGNAGYTKIEQNASPPGRPPLLCNIDAFIDTPTDGELTGSWEVTTGAPPGNR